MATKTLKLSKTMQAAMDEFINAPVVDYRGHSTIFHLKEDSVYAPGLGKEEDGTISTYQSSATLAALAKRGLIEVVKDGGSSYDKVRLLQHENKSVSMFEKHNLVEVEVYLKTPRDWDGRLSGCTEFVEDGIAECAFNYWDHVGCRADIQRVVRKEDGVEIYNADKK